MIKYLLNFVYAKASDLIYPALRPAIFHILDEYLISSPAHNLNLVRVADAIATQQSAQFIIEQMPLAKDLIKQEGLLRFALDNAIIEGLYLEFGVWKGSTIRYIAERAGQTIYGFDSFTGVEKQWTYRHDMKHFDLGGQPPINLPSNVELVVGYFEDTLPVFVVTHNQPIRFLHVDSDIYDSATTILSNLSQNIVSGSIIVFDNYFNYPTWQQHEHKAFREFTDRFAKQYEYIGFASTHLSVAVRIC